MAYTIFGAIDVGSSDVTLTIYEIGPKNLIRSLDRVSHIMELGADSYTNGEISYPIVDELCEILLKFKIKLDEYKVDAYEAVAASAIREASNCEMILDQIRVRTGIEVKPMSNSELRFVTYMAMAYYDTDFDRIIQRNTAIVDIGAGSIQLSLFDKQHLVHTQNIRIGTLRMREILSDIQYHNVTFYKLVEEYVGNEIDTFQNLYLKDREFKNIIAIGDEIFNLVKIVPELSIKDTINRNQIDQICKKLQNETADNLYVKYGIPQEVGTLLLSSAIIYRQFLLKSKADTIWFPLITVCDGIAVNYAVRNGKIKLNHDFNEDIISTAFSISKRYKCNKIHVQNVKVLALDIFDHMKKLHGLSNRERMMLEIAVILHDCGKFINMKDPAPNSYNIIMNSEIIGISHKEREAIAYIAMYNTLEFPSYDNIKGKLDVDEYLTIAKLTAILRIANALDRSHKQKIEKFTINVRGREMIITADTVEDLSLENGLFKTKVDYFEKVYGVRPVLKQRRRV